jgi:hypothetical protein
MHLKMAEVLGTWRPVDPELVFDQMATPIPKIVDTTH